MTRKTIIFKLVVNHLRNSIRQSEFKVHTFQWMSLIKVNEAVQAIEGHLINKVVLCLTILLLRFDPTVLHSPFTPDVMEKPPMSIDNIY